MNRIIAVFLLFLSFPAYSRNEQSTIKKAGENVYIAAPIDRHHKINYWFRKCMANDLFTFYRVSIISGSEETIVNEAHSDNIGPFQILNGGWCGGNHLYSDGKTKTAETFSVKLYVDAQRIASDTALEGRTIELEVKNYIFNPLSAEKKDDRTHFTDTLCIETVTYTVSGGNIQVDLAHDYTNQIPVTIVKYYGMQSMFKDESQLLTPSGEYINWTDIHKVDRFKKKDFPRFNRYIEKGKSCFQASCLLNTGLGTHTELPDEDVIFIGNSWTKSYHKLIGNAPRTTGDRDAWSGIYTWFTRPLLDTGSAFAYDGYMEGGKVIFFSNTTTGKFTVPLPDNVHNQKINIIENTSGMEIKKHKDFIYFCCSIPGSAVISFEK